VTSSRSPLRGSAFLVGAALCWGLGFYAQRMSLTTLTPLWATSARFVLAVPLALIVLQLRSRTGVPIPWRAGLVCGVVVAFAFALQTIAMLHTPVSRVALLTGLYGVLTPLLQPLFGLRRPTTSQLVAAAVATAGTALLCGIFSDQSAQLTPPNVGDALTLVMAVVSAFYVLFLARLGSSADALALNAVQVLGMAACSVIIAPLFEGWPAQMPDHVTWASVVYLAIASTFIAFLLQILGQRDVSPATAAVLMLLETPIGIGAAVLLLGERMMPAQWVGAVLALVAVLLAIVAEHRAGAIAAPHAAGEPGPPA
jgi:drug/metabolite transporter (DMT)-like permease